MDQARRERIRELIRTLESAQRQVHDLWIAEESAFEGRSPPSKETELGQISSNAADDLERAMDHLSDAVEHLQGAAGDAGAYS
jgi:hypothetical protein